MIFDICKCGAEFRVACTALHAATDERFAHSEWLTAHASCRVVAVWEENERLRAQVAALQARVDALMLELCRDGMTKEQKETWARHQRPVRFTDC